jgi:ubiquinone/menaquinone biosynthesis C-methylase UbiE
MNFGEMKQIVAAGYDQVAERYESWAAGIYSPERERTTALLIDSIPAGSRVLELGSGNGEPTARILSQNYDLTGVDISSEQLERARKAVPRATFIQSDMTRLDFPQAHFEAVLALFSLVHVPCEEHGRMLASIYRWLKPGGLLVFNSGASAAYRGYEVDWLGAPMFWSHYDPETTRKIVLKTGFRILGQRVESINEGHGAATFVWWTAVKPLENARQ